MGRLTKTGVDKLATGEALWDGETRGFGVRRQRRDATFVLKVRIHGRQRFLTIGKHGAPWTVETARKEALRLLSAIAQGHDPAGEREDARDAMTVGELADAFLSRHVATKRKASTAALYRQLLNTRVLPTLRKRRVTDVTKTDVAKLHHDQRNTPCAANHAVTVLAAMYAWAGKAGLIDEGVNPARNVERFREHPRERFLTSAEMESLGTALGTADIAPAAKAAIRLLMFTGCRLREILHLEWQHVDVERGVLFLPDSKTGQKTVVLSAPALAVLVSLPHEGRYVISGLNSNRPRFDLKRPWATVTKNAKLDALRIHDLRHTFASVGVGMNIGLPMIGKLLGHARAHTTERYAHHAVDPVRRSADMIAGRIEEAMSGKATDNVVQLKR